MMLFPHRRESMIAATAFLLGASLLVTPSLGAPGVKGGYSQQRGSGSRRGNLHGWDFEDDDFSQQNNQKPNDKLIVTDTQQNYGYGTQVEGGAREEYGTGIEKLVSSQTQLNGILGVNSEAESGGHGTAQTQASGKPVLPDSPYVLDGKVDTLTGDIHEGGSGYGSDTQTETEHGYQGQIDKLSSQGQVGTSYGTQGQIDKLSSQDQTGTSFGSQGQIDKLSSQDQTGTSFGSQGQIDKLSSQDQTGTSSGSQGQIDHLSSQDRTEALLGVSGKDTLQTNAGRADQGLLNVVEASSSGGHIGASGGSTGSGGQGGGYGGGSTGGLNGGQGGGYSGSSSGGSSGEQGDGYRGGSSSGSSGGQGGGYGGGSSGGSSGGEGGGYGGGSSGGSSGGQGGGYGGGSTGGSNGGQGGGNSGGSSGGSSGGHGGGYDGSSGGGSSGGQGGGYSGGLTGGSSGGQGGGYGGGSTGGSSGGQGGGYSGGSVGGSNVGQGAGYGGGDTGSGGQGGGYGGGSTGGSSGVQAEGFDKESLGSSTGGQGSGFGGSSAVVNSGHSTLFGSGFNGLFGGSNNNFGAGTSGSTNRFTGGFGGLGGFRQSGSGSSSQFGGTALGASGGKPPMMMFPGELTPSGNIGHSFSSSSSSNRASQQSSSSSSHHSFGIHGGQQAGGFSQLPGNFHQTGQLGGGNLLSGGKLAAVPVGGLHYSGSSHSSSSASQASNSDSHQSATFHTSRGGLQNSATGTQEKQNTAEAVFDKDAFNIQQTQNKADKAAYTDQQTQNKADKTDLNADTSQGKDISGGQEQIVGGDEQIVKDKVDEGYGGVGTSSWADKWNSITNWGSNTARRISDTAHSAASTIRDKVVAGVNKVPSIWEKFKKALTGFGTSIHQGAEYCAHVLQQKTNDIQSSAFLQKLEGKVEQGNEEVMQFFTVLGDKIRNWADQHANEGKIDEGLSGGGSQSGQTVVLQKTKDFEREDFPDFFQDAQVQGEIEKLVQGGIIEQKEADLFTQQKQGRP